MCKLLIIPHIPEGKSKFAWRLAKAITPTMTRMDDDGFGYAAVTTQKDSDGREIMLAEKWLFPKDAWSNRLPGEFAGLEQALQGGLDSNTYRHYGFDLKEGGQRPAIKSLMLHSRYSTCGGGVENSHPFVVSDKEGPWAAFIHNGVVSKEGLRFDQSTCDSEGILNSLVDEQVAWEPGNLQKALDKVHGYYAYGFLSLTVEDGWVMDVVKDGLAQLSALYIHEIGAVVYATSSDQVESACKKLKWKRPRIAKMRSNTRVRYSVNTGEVLLIDGFKSAEYARQGWHQAHANGQYKSDHGGTYTRAWDDYDEQYFKQKELDKKGASAATQSMKSGTGEKPWACIDCGETFYSEYGAENCKHGLETMAGKRGSLTPEQSEVQAALAGMEESDNRRAIAEVIGGTIDPTTGAIIMSDGSVVEIADEPIEEETESVKV